jgi:hypothetical protein
MHLAWRKRPKVWTDMFIVDHDNAPAHHALKVHGLLAKKSITKMDHPPYLPDLAPYDFWTFPKLKNAPKKQIFAKIPHIHCNVMLVQHIQKMTFKILSGRGHQYLTKCIAS